MQEQEFLNAYMNERLPLFRPGIFEMGPDNPDFTNDLSDPDIESPPYLVG
jgi:hypothetical protein